MPIDTQSALLRLSPMSAIDIKQGTDKSLERQRLALMREQFEQQKEQQARVLEQQRIEEQGRMAREKLKGEREQAKADAAAKAELDKQRREAHLKFTELAGKGDIEGAHAMIPFMGSLGMRVENLGEQDGLPAYRVSADAEQDDAKQEYLQQAQAPYGEGETPEESLDRLATMGYPGNDTGVLDASPGIASSDETDESGRSVTDRYVAATNLRDKEGLAGAAQFTPIRGPDEPDYTGGVPNDVVDFGALHAQTMRRLDPALGALAGGYPEELQGSVREAGQAAAGMGLPAAAALDTALKLREGPDAMYRAKLAADAQQNRFTEGQKESRTEKQRLLGMGYDEADKAFVRKDIGSALKNTESAKMVIDNLTNDDPNDDGMIGFALADMLHSRGAQSNKDLQVALGLDSSSTLDQILERVHQIVAGGFRDVRKETIINVVRKSMDLDEGKIFDFLHYVDTQKARPDMDPDVYRGWRQYRDVIPEEYRQRYDERQKAERGGSAPSAPAEGGGKSAGLYGEGIEQERAPEVGDGEFEDEFYAQAADAGLDAEKILPLVHAESGGKANAVNADSGATGLIQFLPSVAKGLGTSVEEIKKMSRVEQIPLVLEYLKRAGVTPEHDQGDIYVAIAAPAALDKAPETKVYEKGTDEYDLNKGWDLDDDGVITRDELHRYGSGERRRGKGAVASTAGEAPAAAPGKLPPPKTEAERAFFEALGGG